MNAQNTESVEGMLRSLAPRDLVLETSATKVFRFRLVAATEFHGPDGKPYRDSLLNPGDRIAVYVSPGDVETAINVVFIRVGSALERQAGSAPLAPSRIAAPTAGDFDGPRGTAAPGSVPPIQAQDDSPDAIITAARAAVQSSYAGRPDFVAERTTTRYTGPRQGDKWSAADVVTDDYVVTGTNEEYRNVKVNGRLATRPPEDSGSWSTGEASMAEGILWVGAAATFTPRGQDRIGDRSVWMFDFTIDQARSNWSVYGGAREYKPAYGGAIGIDRETRRALRVEFRALDLPGDFPLDRISVSLESGFVDLNGRPYLMPVRSVSESCGRGASECNRNVAEFRNYRTGTLAPENNSPPVTVAPAGSPVAPGATANPKDGLTYAWIPPGSFTMGCSDGDTECYTVEKPPHAESIASGFWMSRTEVTQAAWLKVMGNNPSRYKGDQLPVENVAWADAGNYCRTVGGRLPTEREWEYAARAGTTLARYANIDAAAWYGENSGGTTHPVASKQPNTFGLFDILGNVWEWVEDSYPGSSDKIVRGGSHQQVSTNTRASRRGHNAATHVDQTIGFRCAMDEPSPGAKNQFTETIYPVGNGVSSPKVLSKVKGGYTQAALNAKLSGTVVLDVVIDSKGNVVRSRVRTSLGMGLDEKAREAVSQWKFAPGIKDGKPVAVTMPVEVGFRVE